MDCDSNDIRRIIIAIFVMYAMRFYGYSFLSEFFFFEKSLKIAFINLGGLMQIILFISSLLVFVQVMKIQSFMLHDNKKSAINADCLLQKSKIL